MTSRTPGPWTLETVKTSCGVCHKIGPFPWRDYDGKPQQNHACIYVDYGQHSDELLANAAFIVKAVNSHDQLVEALEAAQRWMDDFDDNYLTKEDYAAKLNSRALLSQINEETET